MPIVSAEGLRALNTALFESCDVPHDVADQVSKHVVDNCLYGHDSHAMALVPRFIHDIEVGKIQPRAKTQVIKETACLALLDGGRGFGQITLTDAMHKGIELARGAGISAVSVTNCNHVGIMWTFLKMAVDQKMIAMIWCVSGAEGGGGAVAPPGGKAKAIGANPIGLGIPAGEMTPMILDFCIGGAARGKIVLHAQQGKPIPPGWLLDEHGNPTTDPNDLLKDGEIVGTMLPMAGYKGFGLGLFAEILGGVLTGYGAAHRSDYREGQGVFVNVIDVETFMPFDEFARQTDALLRHIKSGPTDDQTDEILTPGELESRARPQRERDGIPVTDKVWGDLTALAVRQNLNVDALVGTVK